MNIELHMFFQIGVSNFIVKMHRPQMFYIKKINFQQNDYYGTFSALGEATLLQSFDILPCFHTEDTVFSKSLFNVCQQALQRENCLP